MQNQSFHGGLTVMDVAVALVAQELGVQKDTLLALLNNPRKYWHLARTLKAPWRQQERSAVRRGEVSPEYPTECYRFLWIPREPLMEVLRQIHRVYLKPLPVRPECHGFVEERSIRTAALVHARAEYRHFLRLDLFKAFDQICRKQVIAFLRRTANLSRDEAKVLARLMVWKNRLPTGSPTSPRLFVAMLTRPIEAIAANLDRDIVMTCCSDDFILSSRRPFHRKRIETIIKLFGAHGLRVNYKKIRVGDVSRSAVRIPGLVIKRTGKNNGIGLPHKVALATRAMLYRALQGEVDPAQVHGRLGYVKLAYGSTENFPSGIRHSFLRWRQAVSTA